MAKYRILDDGTIELINNYDYQNFDNHFNELGNNRFDIGLAMIYCLFAKQRWDSYQISFHHWLLTHHKVLVKVLF